jgi:DNA-binding transcriptional LysR family regulator
MNTEWLRSFVEVARQQSYSRAAERLYLSQPTVYHHVRLLETHLGVRLLQQRGKRAELTAQGKTLFERAVHILEAVAALRAAAADDASLARGQLHVGAATTFGAYLLPWLLAAFHRLYPGIEITAKIVNDPEQLDALVRDGEIDVAINPGGQQSADLFKVPVMRDPMVLVAPPCHPLARLPFATPPGLAGIPLVVFPRRAAFRQALEIWFAEAGQPLSVVMTLGSQESIKRAVLAGAGVAVLSYCTVADEVANGQLVAIPLRPRLERYWYLSLKAPVKTSHSLEAFLRLLHSDGWIPSSLREQYATRAHLPREGETPALAHALHTALEMVP